MQTWSEHIPIYVQIATRLTQSILDGSFAEGQAVPSVRAWANELAVNPITVSRAYQELLDRDIIQTKRGMGMFVAPSARAIDDVNVAIGDTGSAVAGNMVSAINVNRKTKNSNNRGDCCRPGAKRSRRPCAQRSGKLH